MDSRGGEGERCSLRPADAYRVIYVLSTNIRSTRRDPWEASDTNGKVKCEAVQLDFDGFYSELLLI